MILVPIPEFWIGVLCGWLGTVVIVVIGHLCWPALKPTRRKFEPPHYNPFSALKSLDCYRTNDVPPKPMKPRIEYIDAYGRRRDQC